MINEKEIKNHFIEYITRRREEMEIPSWYVGYYGEVCDGTFREYMKGVRLPRPTALVMIGELFECTVNDLLGYKYARVPLRRTKFNPGVDTRILSENFYSQMARRMIRKRIDLDELASIIGMTSQTLDGYFKSNSLPDTSTILRICDALDCTPSDLLGY